MYKKGDFMNRRKFLHRSGLLAAGALATVAGLSCNDDAPANQDQQKAPPPDAPARGTLEAFGIQLWTLRDEMAGDPVEVLRQVAAFGYSQIENFEGPRGLWWGMSHTAFRQHCDELGLAPVASHCNFVQDFETKAAQAAEVGMKYLVAPWVGPQQSIDDFRRIAETFNRCGEICRQHGLRFAYHNHDYSFQPLDGALPQDVMMQETDPELVDFEMDIYWVVTAGADPVEWLNKYPGRWRLCHIKDRKKDAPPDEREASCILGTGSIDFPRILKVARDQGMQYYLVEQEQYEQGTPYECARANAAYLRRLKI